MQTKHVIEDLNDLKSCIDGQSTPQFPAGAKVKINTSVGNTPLFVTDSEDNVLDEFVISPTGVALLTGYLQNEGFTVEAV
jgi:hypothetical protein